MISYFIMGITFAFAAAVQPGPFQTYLISHSLSVGWRRTLPAALSPLISDGPIALIALLALSYFSRAFLYVLQCAGGFFLFYLAIQAANVWRVWGQAKIVHPQSSRQSMFKAATVNLLNPNPYLAWSLVMGPLLLKGWHEKPEHGLALLFGFYGTMIAANGGIIVLFGAARNLGARLNRSLIGISSVALGCFAIYELWLGIYSLTGR